MKSSNPLHAVFHTNAGSARLVVSILVCLVAGTMFIASTSAQVTTSVQTDTVTTQTAAARGNSTVRGRVVYDDTGRPLRRVRVMLFEVSRRGEGRGLQRMAVTDGRGEFVIKNVVEGKFRVYVDAPGVVRQAPFGGTDEEVATVSVDGTSNAEVQVRARRGGAISGKITYSDGDPAINAMVSLMVKRGKQLSPYYVGGFNGSSIQTDDRGLYRIFGLPPGEYIVGVGEQSQRVEEREDGGVQYNSSYGTLSATYYPSVTTRGSATPVQVEAGQETTNINITLSERSLHKISGTLRVRRDGQIVTAASISIVNKQEMNGGMLGSQSVQPDAQGRWYFDDVPDGEYLIVVYPVQDESPEARARAASGPRTRGFVQKNVDVVVAGVDVTGLTIEVTEGARISGTVTLEGGKPIPLGAVVFTRDASGTDDSFNYQRSAQAQVNKDGTFTMASVPDGVVSLLASVPPGGKYYTKSVTANGIDILRDPLRVEDETEIKDVRITIASDVGTVTGRVLSAEDGKPLRGMNIMLIPADPDLLRIFGPRAYAVSGVDGTFTTGGAPGDYLAIIWRQNNSAMSAEAIKELSQNAPRVTLQPNERKTIDLVAPREK